MLSQVTPVTGYEVVAVPRFTFAGVCMYCLERGCTSANCLRLHASAVWAVCPDCDGTLWRKHNEERCCPLGVVEVVADAAANPAETQGSGLAVPVSVPPVFISAPLPRCLGCGVRTATVHPKCVAKTAETVWFPCEDCAGLRVDDDGFECQLCCGAGFVPADADMTLAEMAGDVRPW